MSQQDVEDQVSEDVEIGACHVWPAERTIQRIDQNSARLTELLATASLDDPVPTCPGWSLGTLAKHVASFWRLAEQVAQTGRRLTRHDFTAAARTYSAADPIGWLQASRDMMLAALRSVPLHLPVVGDTVVENPSLLIRRILAECTMHGADVMLAAGHEPVVEPELAITLIDERLVILPHHPGWLARRKLQGDGQVLVFAAGDVGVAWMVRMLPDGFSWSHVVPDATDVRVTGTASDLLLLLYRRLPVGAGSTALDGDSSALEAWLAQSRF